MGWKFERKKFYKKLKISVKFSKNIFKNFPDRDRRTGKAEPSIRGAVVADSGAPQHHASPHSELETAKTGASEI